MISLYGPSLSLVKLIYEILIKKYCFYEEFHYVFFIINLVVMILL